MGWKWRKMWQVSRKVWRHFCLIYWWSKEACIPVPVSEDWWIQHICPWIEYSLKKHFINTLYYHHYYSNENCLYNDIKPNSTNSCLCWHLRNDIWAVCVVYTLFCYKKRKYWWWLKSKNVVARNISLLFEICKSKS